MHTEVSKVSEHEILLKKCSAESVHSSQIWDKRKNFFLQAKEIYQCTRSEALVGEEAEQIHRALKRQFKKLGLPFKRRVWTRSVAEFYKVKERLSTSHVPESCGVYFLYGKNEELLYIGKAKNLKKRLDSHFSSDLRVPVDKKLRRLCFRIDFEYCLNELAALLMESSSIKEQKPKLNRALKRRRTPYKIALLPGKKNFLTPKLLNASVETDTPLEWTFSSKTKQESFVEELYRDGSLCRTPGVGRPCFYRQVDICHGACVGEETSEQYKNLSLIHI